MSSKVEICNQALIEIGARTITSLSEGTPEANMCSQVYDISARSVMSQGAWRSCTFQSSLNKISSSPLYGFDNQFQLPTDPEVLRVLSVQNEHIDDIKYEIQQDKLLADESAVNIKYIGFLTDPTAYGQFLEDAIIFKIASVIAYKLTGSRSASADLKTMYNSTLRRNLSQDGQQGSSIKLHDDTLLKDR